MADATDTRALPSDRSDFWRRARRSPNVMIGGALVLIVLVIALIGPLFIPYDPTEVDMLSVWAEPG
ncbi:MAG: ABC transporter permease, partial [Rhodobiaceae bacterium]|nr:ABC transporter permease [Rhodobiaceae bacterium]